LDGAEAISCDKEAQMSRVMLHTLLVIEALMGQGMGGLSSELCLEELVNGRVKSEMRVRR